MHSSNFTPSRCTPGRFAQHHVGPAQQLFGDRQRAIKPGRPMALEQPREASQTHIRDLVQFLIWGAAPSNMAERLCSPQRMIGVDTLTSVQASSMRLRGWARPDEYPPRNNRTNKAIKSLGHDVRLFSDSPAAGAQRPPLPITMSDGMHGANFDGIDLSVEQAIPGSCPSATAVHGRELQYRAAPESRLSPVS
jgi:hypothetical protein